MCVKSVCVGHLNYESYILVTSVCDQKDGIFIQSLRPVQSHLIAELLNDIQSHLKKRSMSTLNGNICFVLHKSHRQIHPSYLLPPIISHSLQ